MRRTRHWTRAGRGPHLRETMEYAVDQIEKPLNLTEAIDAVLPLKPDRQLMAHRFDGEFSLGELSLDEASQYSCQQMQKPSAGPRITVRCFASRRATAERSP